MKKALGVVAALALVVWVVSWFRTPQAVATSGAQSWPGDLGPLRSVAARYPVRTANDAAVKLAALVNALPKDQAVEEFVSREISRGELQIGGGPSIADVTAIRDLLLAGDVVWERPGGVGEIGDGATQARRVVAMTAARVLVASALTKARGNDSAAWEDLRAVWNLARSLDPQPQVMEQTAALAMLRMIGGVAWKMPLPAPGWLGEVQRLDYVPRLVEAFQYQAASYWQSGGEIFPTKFLSDSVEHDRRIAEGLVRETRCDINAKANQLGVDLAFVWRRAFRHRAEREAMANALRVREGKPIVEKSMCSDGNWSFDGTMLRFSREIPTAAPDRPMPLVLRLR